MKVLSKVEADVTVTLEISGTTLARLTALLGHHNQSSHRQQGIPERLVDKSSGVFGELHAACQQADIDYAPYYKGEK